jgi:hypothetical protein
MIFEFLGSIFSLISGLFPSALQNVEMRGPAPFASRINRNNPVDLD